LNQDEKVEKTDCCVLVPCLDKTEDINKETLKMINPIEITKSYTSGLGKARNDLVKNSENKYLFFVDCGVSFSKKTYKKLLGPAIKNKKIIVYRGENGILCTKILGLPRRVFLSVGGFDESFHIGEDMEFGFRLQHWLKEGEYVEVPKELLDHREYKERGSYFTSLKVRVRCALRYRRFDLLKIQRKKDFYGVFFIPFILSFYLLNNKRRSYKC